jgi:hypothetical protein
MISPWQSDGTIIDRVRIRSRSADPLRDQQRIAALLGQMELRPRRLLPSSILCVHKMQDPLPRVNWLQDKSILAAHEWERAAEEQLDRLAAKAARPAFGTVAPSAEAVLFEDRAEWLACLAQDWVRGSLRWNWWWAAALRGGDPDQVLKREWLGSAEYVPAAFEILAARSGAVPFLQKVPEALARELFDAMMFTFRIPTISRDTHAAASIDHKHSAEQAHTPGKQPRKQRTKLDPNTNTAAERTKGGQAEGAFVDGEGAGHLEAPWLRSVPEADIRDVSPLHRALLGQALMLRRAPGQLRSFAFQVQVKHWLSVQEVLSQFSTRRYATDSTHGSQHEEASFPSELQKVDGAGPSLRNGEPVVLRPTNAERPATESSPDDAGKSTASNSPTSHNGAAEDTLRPHANTAREKTRLETGPDEDCVFVHSELAGVFFLLNLALYLDLYRDFSSPRDKDIELDIWDFLRLLMLAFVGAEGSRSDPVWQVLTKLAGRQQDEPIGTYFDPPEIWHMPSEWLEPFSEELARQKVERDGRIQVWHPAGFLVLDDGLGPGVSPQERLLQWLSWIVPYVRARLVRALGRSDAAEFLIRIPARIALTTTHIHVHYSLDSHPIEIRLAGLDRDPGWIPAAGRYVSFFFE